MIVEGKGQKHSFNDRVIQAIYVGTQCLQCDTLSIHEIENGDPLTYFGGQQHDFFKEEFLNVEIC